jgi:hypothetical protein
MSAKAAPPPATNILREEQAWGVRLIVRPFLDPRQNLGMEMSAEIKDVAGRNPEIKIWFSGVPALKLLPYTDSIIWVHAMTALQEEARKVSDEMKAKKKPKKKA